MLIRQRIPDILTLPAEFDQMHFFQEPQLMGNGALAQFHGLSDFRYATLPLLQQRKKQLNNLIKTKAGAFAPAFIFIKV